LNPPLADELKNFECNEPFNFTVFPVSLDFFVLFYQEKRTLTFWPVRTTANTAIKRFNRTVMALGRAHGRRQ